MSLVSTSPRSLRSTLAVLTLATATAFLPRAHALNIQGPYAIGQAHAEAKPYNFTGRIYDLDFEAFGSGTLVRRHTVLTAGHVVFDPTLGFTQNTTFTRALYQDAKLSIDQVVSVATISGYQADIVATGNNANLVVFGQDQGYVILNDPPVDEDWANYSTTPSLLTSSATFVLGYPGETFDGLTMAYIVPPDPFVPSGTSLGTGSYENGSYNAQEGMSGGPIYVVPDGVNRYVAGSTVGGLPDASGEFTQSFIRAIDKASNKFLTAAEYTTGLIKQVKVTGPKTVSRGQTYTYTTNVVFSVAPTLPGATATTDRYAELKLKSSTPGTSTQPLVTVKKTSNTTFSVTFSPNIRSGSTTTLQVYYSGTGTPSGKSSKIIKIQ